MKNFFTTDDYTVLDLSGQELNNKFFRFSGSYLSLVEDSTSEVVVALGSGGSGPPKEITIFPGGYLELTDKSRPFSGFYVTTTALPVLKILVSNGGVDLHASPSRIAQVGVVERVLNPVGTGFAPPVRPGDLTTSAGEPIEGRYANAYSSSHADGTADWSDLPGAGTIIQRASGPAGNNEGSGTIVGPFTYDIALAGEDSETGAWLYPAAPGDIVYVLAMSVRLGFWFLWNTDQPEPNAILPWQYFQAGIAPIGVGLRLRNALGVTLFNAWETDRDSSAYPVGTTTNVGSGGLGPLSQLGLVGARGGRHAEASADRKGWEAYIADNADAYTSLCFHVRNQPIILTDAGMNLRLELPVPCMSVAIADETPNEIVFRSSLVSSPAAGRASMSKPPVTVHFAGVLLKKGEDF